MTRDKILFWLRVLLIISVAIGLFIVWFLIRTARAEEVKTTASVLENPCNRCLELCK